MKIKQLEMRQNMPTNGMTEKKYYIIYARKSSEDEDRQMASIEDQVKVLKDLARAKNLPILKIFKESKSAKAPGRPVFNEKIDLINSRDDIKGIICWKLNRESRNPVDTGTLQWLLASRKIEEIVTPSRTYYEADSDFIMAVEGAQAQRFIRDLKEDTARGVNSKLSKGMAPILALPGYKNDITKRQGERDIIPNEVQFPLVRKLLELFMTRNFSVQQLWCEAQKLNIRNSRGQLISKTQLYKMLRNPFYTGTRFIYAGKLYTNGVHKRMITDAEFDLIQEILDGRSHPRGEVHRDLLTGIMRCGECGMMITSEVKTKHYKNGNSQTFVYYRCTKKFNAKKCTQSYLPAKELEEQVISFLDSITLSEDFAQWAIKWLQVMHSNQEELRAAKYKATEQSYQEVVKRLNNATEMMLKGALQIDRGMEIQKELELEKSRLHEELTKMDSHVTEWSNLAVQTFDLVRNIKERFTNGSIEQRKTILRTVGSNLVIFNKKVDITIRNPFEYIQKAVSVINDGEWLEPDDLPDLPTQIGILQCENFNWGGRRDSNPQPLVPQTSAPPIELHPP